LLGCTTGIRAAAAPPLPHANGDEHDEKQYRGGQQPAWWYPKNTTGQLC
jgi:hypothetical protein